MPNETKRSNGMHRYRSRVVEIDAFRMTRERRSDNSEWPEWLNRAWNEPHGSVGGVGCVDYPNSNGTDELQIVTIEGTMRVSFGDWIIRGTEGELYPCKDSVFQRKYELTTATAVAAARANGAEGNK